MPISAGLREDIAVYRGFIGQQYLSLFYPVFVFLLPCLNLTLSQRGLVILSTAIVVIIIMNFELELIIAYVVMITLVINAIHRAFRQKS